MKKILVLSVGLLAVSVQASNLSIKKDTLLYLAKITSGVRMVHLGMWATGVMGLEHHVVGEVVSVVRGSFDEVYHGIIESGVPSGLADYLALTQKINMSIAWLGTPPTLPESIELIRIGQSFLYDQLTEQSLIEDQHTATGLHTLSEIGKLVGASGQMVYIDEAQVEQLDKLVGQFSHFFVETIQSYPAEIKGYLQNIMSITEKVASSHTPDAVENLAVVVDQYQAIEYLLYMGHVTFFFETHLDAKMRIEQELGRPLMEGIVEAVNIGDEHLAMTFNYLAGDLSSHDFVENYRQFLNKYSKFFSTEELDKAEQKLLQLEKETP